VIEALQLLITGPWTLTKVSRTGKFNKTRLTGPLQEVTWTNLILHRGIHTVSSPCWSRR